MSAPGRAARAVAALVGRHRLFVALLALGVGVRVLVTYAYRPALFYTGDSYTYLHVAETFDPDPQRPVLYSAFLRPLLETGVLTLVPTIQHALGLGVAVAVYALVRRAGAASWLGCLASAPVLLDGLQVTLEHYLLAEALFEALVVGALALAVWQSRPSPRVAVAVGLLLAAAALTRTVGVVLVAPVVVYLVLRRAGATAVALLVVAFAVPLLGYAAWFESHVDRYHLTAYEGYFLYGRVGPFVDCRGVELRADERPLCSAASLPDQRPTWYVFAPASPIHSVRPHPGRSVNDVAGGFARTMIRRHPGEYARAAAGDFAGYFRLRRTANELQSPIVETALPPDRIAYYDPERALLTIQHVGDPHDLPVVERSLARRLAAWQDKTWLPGPLLALAALLAVAAPFAAPAGARPPSASAGVLFAACALLLLAFPAATATFDWRFVVPALPLFGVAGALGLHELMRTLPSSE